VDNYADTRNYVSIAEMTVDSDNAEQWVDEKGDQR